jgi:tripartite ATP-independent transporter DctP family solute receptor
MERFRKTDAPMAGRRLLLKSSLAAAAVARFAVAAPAIAAEARVLRFGSMMPVGSIYNRACERFGAELAKLSSNKLKVQVYPDSQLGTIPEMLSAVQVGSLQMTMAVPAWYSRFIKPLDAFTLPYIVPSAASLRTALDGALGKRISQLGEGAGFVMAGYWLIGGRHIVNKVRPVYTPANCKGLKIRVINSKVYIDTFRDLGAIPVAMDPSELYLALQRGVVDGFEFPLPDLVSYKLYEVSKYLSLDDHTTDFFLLSMNKALWHGMSGEEQGMISQAMRTAMDWQWKEQPGEIAAALAKLRTLLKVNELTAADKELFIKATHPVYAEFQDSIGRDFLALCHRELTPS